MKSAIAAAALYIAASGSAALAASEDYALDPFSAVDIASGIEARIDVGPAQSVTADAATANDLGELRLEVRNGTLHAWADWGLLDLFALGGRRITLTITVPALDAATASSGADIDVTGISGETVTLNASSGADIDARNAAASSFRINVSSGAELSVAGACRSARMNISAGARLNAEGLACAEVDANASSGANARVFASTLLRADASSGASIEALGSPDHVDAEESSGGRVRLRR